MALLDRIASGGGEGVPRVVITWAMIPASCLCRCRTNHFHQRHCDIISEIIIWLWHCPYSGVAASECPILTSCECCNYRVIQNYYTLLTDARRTIFNPVLYEYALYVFEFFYFWINLPRTLLCWASVSISFVPRLPGPFLFPDCQVTGLVLAISLWDNKCVTTERLHFGNLNASFVTYFWQLATKNWYYLFFLETNTRQRNKEQKDNIFLSQHFFLFETSPIWSIWPSWKFDLKIWTLL